MHVHGLYQLALLDICIVNIGSVIGIGRFWEKYNRYQYNLKLPYQYTSNLKCCILGRKTDAYMQFATIIHNKLLNG